MRNEQKAANIFAGILAVLAFYVGDRAWMVYDQFSATETVPFMSLLQALNNLMPTIREAPFSFSFEKNALLAGLLCAGAVLFWRLYTLAGQANKRPGEEYGSSRWGTISEAHNYANTKEPSQNIILSQNISMTMDRPKDWIYDRNLNVLAIGGSGSGKTQFLLMPNLMQLNSSFVVTDPKSTVLMKMGNSLLQNQYALRTFNTLDFRQSMHYNPLAYVKTEEDVLKLVTVIMENTTGKGEQKNEDFWIKSERMWLMAHIGYLYFNCPDDLNFAGVLTLLKHSEAREEDEGFINAVDILFEEFAKQDPENFACNCYADYKLNAGRTAKSILGSVAARLAPFNIPALREITRYDEMDIRSIGLRKTALFISVSATDSTYDFLVAMLIYQIFDTLTTMANIEHDGELPMRVQFFLDEFANCIGKIPDFEKTIAVIRSQRMNAWIFLQSLAQLSALYGKETGTVITDNCDWTVFLGGKSTETAETISKMLGKETIRGNSNTVNHGSQGGSSVQDSGLGRDLMDPSEVGRMPRNKCLVIPANDFPYMDFKYPTLKDKRYKAMKKLNVRKWLATDPLAAQRSGILTKTEGDLFVKNCTEVCTLNAETGEITLTPEAAAQFNQFRNQ